MSDQTWLRSRIVGHGEVDPATLLEHPDNINVHPVEQEQEMDALLRRVGWLTDILVSKESGRIIDGHLRVSMAVRQGLRTVPVAYLDLTPDEEHRALLYLNRTTTLAQIDADMLAGSLALLESESGAVADVLSQYAEASGLLLEEPEPDAPPETPAAVFIAATRVTVGDIIIPLAPEMYQRWQDVMRVEFGFNERAIIAEMLRRIGL